MATYYINADTGDDTTGDGSSALPWATLSKGITGSASGDTIFAQNSTNTYFIANYNTSNRTLLGESTDGVVMTNGGVDMGLYGMRGFTLIENVTFDTIGVSGYYQCVIGGGGTIRNCVFTNITPNVNNPNGIFWGTNFTVTGCIFYYCSANLFANSADNASFVFHNNVYHKDRTVNQLFFLNHVGQTIDMKNNIFHLNSNVNWRRNQDPAVQVFNNNCVYQYVISGAPTGTGNITDDPLFADIGNRNYHLRPTSPCIDAGTLI